MIEKLLKKVDLLAPNVGFYYNNNNKFKTFCGSFFTIIICLLSTAVFFEFSSQLYVHSKPISRFSQELRNKTEVFIEDFPIILLFVMPNGVAINDYEKYFNLFGKTFQIDIDPKTGQTINSLRTVYFSKCDPDLHFKKYKDILIDSIPYKSALCMNLNETSVRDKLRNPSPAPLEKGFNISFYNEYTTTNSRFIDINIAVCDMTIDLNCNNNNEISKQIYSTFYVTTYHIDNFIDLQNYDKPYTTFVNSYTQQLSDKIHKRNYIKVKNTEIKTDSGFMFEDVRQVEFNQLSNIRTDVNVYRGEPYELTYETTRVVDVHYRSYTKIQEAMANTGGVFKFMSTICYLFIEIYALYKFEFDLLNGLFCINSSPTINNRNLVDSVIPINKVDLKDLKKVITENVYNSNKADRERVIHKSLEKSISNYLPLKMNFLEFMKIYLCKNYRSNHIKKDYQRANNLFLNLLSINNVIRRLIKIDKLCNLFTPFDQEKLFDYREDLFETELIPEAIDCKNEITHEKFLDYKRKIHNTLDF